MTQHRIVTVVSILLVVAGGCYLTYLQRMTRTFELINTVEGEDYPQAAEAMEQLVAHGVQLYPQLIRLTKNLDPAARWRGAVMLGELGNPDAGEALIKMLGDADATVRAAAAQALGRLQAGQADDKLAGLVATDQQPLAVRISAAQALVGLAAQEAVPQLSKALFYQPVVEEEAEDDSWQLRAQAARALGAIATSDAITALAARLTDVGESDPRARTALVYALGDALVERRSDNKEEFTVGLEALLESADDEVGDVRLAAIYCLTRISPPEDKRSTVKEVLEQARRDPHYWVRHAASG